MSGSDEAAFYEARAEHYLNCAIDAADPGVARVHYALARLYLRRAMDMRGARDSARATLQQIAQGLA